MSFESSEDPSGDGRRAAHVKWDGKTIALGTFSAQEAAEKCNRAKALTKKWRTTMIPKPDVEWVKNTLERLNIRVVNDRPGRRKKRNINEVEHNSISSHSPPQQRAVNLNLAQSRDQMLPPNNMNMNMNMLNSDVYQRLGRGVNHASYSSLNADASANSLERRLSNSLNYAGRTEQRRLPNSVLASLPNPGNMYNIGNAISGYDTSTNDYQQDNLTALNGDASQRSNNTQQQLANLVFGSNQHYEVLKEHHMNLLKELQETTTLMNMYHSTTQSQQNIDNLGSNLGANLGSNFALNRNQDSYDPYLDQSLLVGQNQLYPSPTSRSNSLGLGSGNRGMSQLGPTSELEAQIANAQRNNNFRTGSLYPLSISERMRMNESRRKDGTGRNN